MKNLLCALWLAFILISPIMAQQRTLRLRIIETSDVHGRFFPYDFINRKTVDGSLARVSTYVSQLRKEYGDRLILLDNGDFLQGQPICYYYNYVDTTSTHVASQLLNYLRYDAATVGNHDIETGHAVYDRWIKESQCPMLGANVIDIHTNQPYLKPYVMLERQGIKVAILGMLTPAIPNWLSEDLWSGLRFEEMKTSARRWMKVLKEEEEADVVIALLHSGAEGGIATPEYEENIAMGIAREIPGLDLVLFGHDHRRACEQVVNSEGKTVVCLNPGNNARYVADAEITIQYDEHNVNGHVAHITQGKQVTGKLMSLANVPVDEQMMEDFSQQIANVKAYVDTPIGYIQRTLTSEDAFFGSSAFTDLIHYLQLRVTGADISLNAPLLFNAQIKAGPIRVSDMFNLYKYENQLYVMRLTGEEIRKHLEMSYSLWANTMTSPKDHLLLVSKNAGNEEDRLSLANPYFNFDSAAGINYEVDVTKPVGEKVKILSMSDGTPFDEQKWYRVAVNSYRGNGGGELLTRGAGIPKDSLESRIIWRSDKDQRHYLSEEIKRLGTIDPQPLKNWKFIPEEWTLKAAQRDKELLFGEKQ